MRKTRPLAPESAKERRTAGHIGEARGPVREASLSGAFGHIMVLQAVAGNRAVSRWLGSPAGDARVQTKLKVSQPGSQDEREADRVADAIGRDATAVAVPHRPETRPGENPSSDHAKSPGALAASQGGGAPLPPDLRAFFGGQFGADFSRVRIHTDHQAARLNQRLSARASTSGAHIFFGPGEYAPHRRAGRRLLAHELTHVLQQSPPPPQRRTPRSGGVRPLVKVEPTALIQRDAEPDASKLPGNEYEFKLEHKGDRWSYSVRFILSKAAPNPLKARGDVADPGTAAGGLQAQLGAAKITRTHQAGRQAANSMALALAKGDLTIAELLPGVTVKTELKALEAKVEAGDVDVNVFKVAVMLEGQLTEAIRATPLGDEIMQTDIGARILEGLKVKVQGRVEINIDPYDAVRLARMAKLNREIAGNVGQSVNAKRKLDALEAENKRIQDHLKKRGSKLKRHQRRQLQARVKRNKAKVKDLRSKIGANKKVADALRKSYQGVAKGLKTKAGRLVGEAVKRVGSRVLLRLVPGVNIALMALDVLEAGVAIYKLLTGKARLGFGGGEGEAGGGREGEEGGAADAGKASGAAMASGGPRDAGVPVAGVEGAEAGSRLTDEQELGLGPEIDVSEELQAGAGGILAGAGVSGGAMPPLNPKARQVYETIQSETDAGQRFGPEDLAQLNDLVADLSDAQLNALIDRIRSQKLPQGDALDALGAILEHVNRLRAPGPVTTVESGGKRQVLPEESAAAGGRTPARERAGKGVSSGTAGGRGGARTVPGDLSAAEAPPGKRTRGERTSTAGTRQSVVRRIQSLGATQVEDVSVTTFNFSVVSGYNPATQYRSGDTIRLKIRFVHEERLFEPTFTVIVQRQERSESGETTLHAINREGWRFAGTNIVMPKDTPITLITRKTTTR